MKLGLLLPTWTGAMDGVTPRTRDVVTLAQQAEAVGFDSVWISDHVYFEPFTDFRVVGVEFPPEFAGVRLGAWECWSLAAAIAATTSRVEIGTLVSNAGFRNPALLAKMVDTIDDLSDGRVILGLGAGDFELEHRAFGYPFDHRIARFEEALPIIKGLLAGEQLTAVGAYHRVEGAQLLPKGPRAKGPPLMIGVLEGKPRMSRLTAQYADDWNCVLGFGHSTPVEFLRHWAPLEAACERVGRDPATLTRHATISVSLADTPFPIPGAVPLSGQPGQIAARLTEFGRAGVDHLSMMLHPWNAAGIEAFADVISALR
jgi:alkanesulfonate monooxygenase SsuD/methylene tetrahydromethanopterin reductase-like flavin-dependent oxidoreductase (luciferase family)